MPFLQATFNGWITIMNSAVDSTGVSIIYNLTAIVKIQEKLFLQFKKRVPTIIE